MDTFSERLRELRNSKELTSKQLAKKLDITESKLSYYMNGKEPSYDLLIRISNYFNVTTDYLVGKSSQKRVEEEVLAHKIQAISENSTANTKRQSDIGNDSVRLHNLLVEYANIEATGKEIDNVWEMVDKWLEGLKLYLEFIKQYNPPVSYPLDEAKKAMSTISKSEHIAASKVVDMIKHILKDDKADKQIKDRVIIETSFGIKSINDDDKNKEKG